MPSVTKSVAAKLQAVTGFVIELNNLYNKLLLYFRILSNRCNKHFLPYSTYTLNLYAQLFCFLKHAVRENSMFFYIFPFLLPTTNSDVSPSVRSIPDRSSSWREVRTPHRFLPSALGLLSHRFIRLLPFALTSSNLGDASASL